MSLQQRFDTFLGNISLPPKAVARIESAGAALSRYLVQTYDVPAEAVFLQGSYANNTAIRPSDGGEYDVDVICICVLPYGVSSASALDDLESKLQANGNYKARIKTKDPCVRLEFAEDDIGKFHVDVVPVRPSAAVDAPLDAPHRQHGWHGTAPREYTDWCRDQGALYARTVKMLKHWRNEQQPVREAIKSIVLQVLVSQCMPTVQDDAARIAATFTNLANYLANSDSPPVVVNPALKSENLAASWPPEAYRNFRAEVNEAQELSRLAGAEQNEAQAAALWSMLFGDEFPSTSREDYGLQLGDYSHAQAEDTQGWTQRLDSRYAITQSARVYRGYGSKHYKPYRHDGPPIFTDNKLRFEAQVYGPPGGDIRWQVANTGGHARSENGLRGEFFPAKGARGGASSDPAVNWESTSYTGVHLIRPVLVVNGNVVAKAPWMRINVINPTRRFTL